MRKHIWMYVFGGVILGIILGILWGVFWHKEIVAPTVNTNVGKNLNTNTVHQNTNVAPPAMQSFSTADLADRDPKFQFSAQIPKGWVAEYVAASHALNFYDPNASGDTSMGQSQLFVTYYTASDFQRLASVEVASKTASTISRHSAMTYQITSIAQQSTIPSQPDWRSGAHTETDLRSSDAQPTVFYTFAKSPAVTDSVFQQILSSVSFTD